MAGDGSIKANTAASLILCGCSLLLASAAGSRLPARRADLRGGRLTDNRTLLHPCLEAMRRGILP